MFNDNEHRKLLSASNTNLGVQTNEKRQSVLILRNEDCSGVVSDTGELLERTEVKSDPLDREKCLVEL